MKFNKKDFWRTVKYTVVAASAGLVQIGSFALMNELIHLPYWVSYLVALVLSVVWNFTLNRRYTFRSNADIKRAMALVLGYYVVFTPLSTLLEHFLTDTALWNEYLVTAINMLINFVTEFLFQRFVVFGKTIDTNSIAQKKQEDK